MIPVALLDANVLIALIDPRHVHHESCHRWFSSRGKAPWASCAVTQNAGLRIVGHPRCSNCPGSPAVVNQILLEVVSHPQHRFWAEAPSLLSLDHVNPGAPVESGQITDTYLLALAMHQGGVLASLDKRPSPLSSAHAHPPAADRRRRPGTAPVPAHRAGDRGLSLQRSGHGPAGPGPDPG